MSYKVIKYLASYYMLFFWNNNYLFIGMNNQFFYYGIERKPLMNSEFHYNQYYQNPHQDYQNPYQNPHQNYQNPPQDYRNPYQNLPYQNPNYNEIVFYQCLNCSLDFHRQQNPNFYYNNLTTNIFKSNNILEGNCNENYLFNESVLNNNQLINNQLIIDNNQKVIDNLLITTKNNTRKNNNKNKRTLKIEKKPQKNNKQLLLITKLENNTSQLTKKNNIKNKRIIKIKNKIKKNSLKNLINNDNKGNIINKKYCNKKRKMQKSREEIQIDNDILNHTILTPTKNEIDKKISYCLLLKEYRLELEIIKNDKLMFKIVIFDTNNTVIIEKSYENIYFYLIWMVIVDCELLKKKSNLLNIIDDKITYKDFFINKNFIEVLKEKFLEEFRPLIPYLKFNYVSLDQVNNFFINYDKSIEYNKELQNIIIDIIVNFENKSSNEKQKNIYIFNRQKIIVRRAINSFFIEINDEKKKINNCYLFELINIMIIFYQKSLANNQKINLHTIISIYYNYIESQKEDSLTKQNLIVGILKSINRKNFTVYFPNIIIDESIEFSSILSLNNQQSHIFINNNNTLQIISINRNNHIFCYYYYNGIKYCFDKKYFSFLSILILMNNIYKDKIIFNKLILNTTKKEMTLIYDFLHYNKCLSDFFGLYGKNSQIKKKNNNNNLMKIE